MAFPIDISTIISSIKLCIEIGETVLANRKEVGELVDDLQMVHDILDTLSPEAKKKADKHKLSQVSKILDHVTKKSSQIFKRLTSKKFIDRIRNTVTAFGIKKDIQDLSARLGKVTGYLNLVFSIQSVNGLTKGGSSIPIPDEDEIDYLEKEADNFAKNPTVKYDEDGDFDD